MDEDRVIEKMKQLVAQAQKLQNVKTSSDDFKKWKTSVRAFLKRLGDDYLEEFGDIRFTPMAYTIGMGMECLSRHVGKALILLLHI